MPAAWPPRGGHPAIAIQESAIKDLSDTGSSRAIVRAAAGLGTSFGIATTAEGVETESQLERIKAEGCTEAQGFLQPAGSGGRYSNLLRTWDRSWATLAA